jgi:hypothetical protein
MTFRAVVLVALAAAVTLTSLCRSRPWHSHTVVPFRARGVEPGSVETIRVR